MKQFADGELARLVVSKIEAFDYAAFNAKQNSLLDQVVETRNKIQQQANKRKEVNLRKAKKLEKEYNILMAEWMWRTNPRFSTTEELVDRLTEIELELSKVL